ncbi:MAG: T9SS type A sorting domain-containing protein [Sphingobacteriales bacterium]|nr:MAG: T9SS type A sorting domain-containing protein [Sphingobacteriales bacterium]
MTQNNPNGLVIQTPNGPIYEVPVVIHVIHTGGPIGSIYNPTDAVLTNMIAYLNQAYAATWASYPLAGAGGTNIPLRFTLAKRTPQCTPTNGIVRVNGSSVTDYVSGGVESSTTIGADEVDVKDLSRWPNDQYYNIWVVNRIDGNDGTSGAFTAGYAYFPGAPASVDGTIMLATQAQAGEITLTHEIGHAFALYHTFEDDLGGGTCPPNTSCSTTGDLVCDTDPHMRSMFNCPTGTNPCTGAPYGTTVHNFMDYSSCQDRFTSGQRTRVLNALLTSRASLISSLGGTALPATPAPVACVPTITNGGTNAGPRTIRISDATTTYMEVSSSGYSGDGNLVYIDNTCRDMVELTAGNIYNFSVQVGFQTENVKVYIDYNNDGTFQANEEALSSPGTSASQNHTMQFTVPTTATIPGLVSCVPLRMRVISDRTTAPPITACGPLGFGQAEDYLVTIRGGGPSTGAVSVALTSGSNPSCFNTPLTFTATPGSGITGATYLWYVNNISTGVTGTTFTSSTLNNNDVVNAKMYFTGPCGTDSSLSVNYTVLRQATVPAAVTIAITNGTNPGCIGQTLTFTATPQNGGTAPVYQWKVNGVNAGTNSDTFSSVLNNNDVVTVELTSNSTCASPAVATSNSITIVHGTIVADVTIAQNDGTNPSCSGKVVGFEATPVNGGTNPQYQWMINGVPVAGATSNSFSSTTLSNNDVITVELIATDPCVSNTRDTSNGITMTINPTFSPVVSVAITAGSNPGCLDSLIEFSATVTDHGANPNLAWFVNGIQVTTGLIYSSNSLMNGDVVTFSSIANDGACYTSDTVVTAPVTMQLFATPAPTVISFIGTSLVSSVANNIVWFGPSGMITGTSGQSYQPTQPGMYYAVVSNGGCFSAPSNMLMISILDIATYDLGQVQIFPNPTSGMLTLDWGSKFVTATLDVYGMTGQGIIHEKVSNESRKVMDLSRLANGTYFILIRDNEGKAGTVKVTLTK